MTSATLESASVHPNARAFLDMISAAEGTTAHGYNTLVGGSRIASLARHPSLTVRLSSTLSSTAAGRYQFLKRTWDALQRKLGLPDFGPHSQDLAALELINEKGALGKVLTGDVTGAINATRKVWASFPGAGYGQGERTLAYMINAYTRAGGKVAGQTQTQVTPVDPTLPGDNLAPISAGDVNGVDLNAVDSGIPTELILLLAAGAIGYFFFFND